MHGLKLADIQLDRKVPPTLGSPTCRVRLARRSGALGLGIAEEVDGGASGEPMGSVQNALVASSRAACQQRREQALSAEGADLLAAGLAAGCDCARCSSSPTLRPPSSLNRAAPGSVATLPVTLVTRRVAEDQRTRRRRR